MNQGYGIGNDIQVMSIEETSTQKLDQKINLFMKSNPNVTILDIKLAGATNDETSSYLALIIFRV